MENFCNQCPRRCSADRGGEKLGYCGVPAEFKLARVGLHPWEEPPISGKNGSGTIFFSGCNLRCVFCQNHEVSHGGLGKTVSGEELKVLMLRLQDEGATNLNLVTPTQYALQLATLLRSVRPLLRIPVVYNCGGYESAETLKELDGLVDVYLPDFKYLDPELSKQYSGASDYAKIAEVALAEMLRQVGKPQYDGAGNLSRGVIVRHLVLPGCRKDSVAVLRFLAQRFGNNAFLLSLMSQYTPSFAENCPYPNLHRRVTSFEYSSVASEAEALGFDGFFQAKESVGETYTPDFHKDTF